MSIICSNLGFILIKLKTSNKKSSSKNFVLFSWILLIELFYEHLRHFWLKLDLLNSVVQTLKNLKMCLTFLLPLIICLVLLRKKVLFNSVKNLVVNRHLKLDFEDNEREEVISAYNFVSGKPSEDNSNDS